jgi:RNA polymerase sigma-70 factor (ECF subfamily)
MITAAKRSMIGRRRRDDTAKRAAPALAMLTAERADVDDSAIPDKRLELLLACAHPAIDSSLHAPLMLQAVFGLDVARMSPLFLVEPATLGQRLVRAKRKIADARIPFTLPGAGDLELRTGAVLDAIYGAYGTGWEDPVGIDPGRAGLTIEALRLVDVLVELRPDDTEVLGLAAQLHHLEARSGARRGDHGEFIPLAVQDPWRWAPAHLARAEQLLNRALAGGEPGAYTLMAAISSLHNRRAISQVINWTAIASLYDRLLLRRPTVGVAVARAAAHLEVGAIDVAADGLTAIDPSLVQRYQPYWTLVAELAARRADAATATAARSRAIELTADPVVRAHLEERWR